MYEGGIEVAASGYGPIDRMEWRRRIRPTPTREGVSNVSN